MVVLRLDHVRTVRVNDKIVINRGLLVSRFHRYTKPIGWKKRQFGGGAAWGSWGRELSNHARGAGP
jgi:hypothetical protein